MMLKTTLLLYLDRCRFHFSGTVIMSYNIWTLSACWIFECSRLHIVSVTS